MVASLMSPVASLVTTDRCSNVSMCLRISNKCFRFPGIVPLLYSVGNKTYYYYYYSTCSRPVTWKWPYWVIASDDDRAETDARVWRPTCEYLRPYPNFSLVFHWFGPPTMWIWARSLPTRQYEAWMGPVKMDHATLRIWQEAHGSCKPPW